MADPVEYFFQNIVDPKLDPVMLIIMTVGMIFSILAMITNFFSNKRLQTYLFDIQDKIKILIENKRTKVV